MYVYVGCQGKFVDAVVLFYCIDGEMVDVSV